MSDGEPLYATVNKPRVASSDEESLYATVNKPRVASSDEESLYATVNKPRVASSDEESLYANVGKPRSNTRTSLDYGGGGGGGGGRGRRVSEQAPPPSSISPPPRDWVVIGREDVSVSSGGHVPTGGSAMSSNEEPVTSTVAQPTTSTPKRSVTSPSLVSSDSAGQPLSSSWVDLPSAAAAAPTNQMSDEPNEPLYMTPRRQRGGVVSTSSLRTVTYRAMYAFTAEQGDGSLVPSG